MIAAPLLEDARAASTLAATACEGSLLRVSGETDGAAVTCYVRDPRGGLLAEHPATGGPYYYSFDGQGSITALTDPAGTVVASYGYDPYGVLTTISGGTVAVDNPWRYTGAYQDGTGWYKIGQRYYDPATGRWTQPDPETDPYDPMQWNRYAYVGDDPLNATDPSGLGFCMFGHNPNGSCRGSDELHTGLCVARDVGIGAIVVGAAVATGGWIAAAGLGGALDAESLFLGAEVASLSEIGLTAGSRYGGGTAAGGTILATLGGVFC